MKDRYYKVFFGEVFKEISGWLVLFVQSWIVFGVVEGGRGSL